MSTLERAIEIAARAHTGQLDKAGEPYILHVLRVMLGVEGKKERITAVLHDVIEDSDISLNDLREEGFDEDVVTAVDLLTKRNGEGRIDAARRTVWNPIARTVKLSDVKDNMNMLRFRNPKPEDHARIEEYKEVKAMLEAHGK